MMSASAKVHILMHFREKPFLGSSLYQNDCNFFLLLRSISVSVCSISSSGCTPSLDINSPKNDILVYLNEIYFYLFLNFFSGISA